jgi:hypothetical protein
MSALEELKENIEHASGGFEKRVALTMAIIAAALAIVSVLGHLAATEELLNQQRASDQWAFYQAKSIRRYTSDVARDILASAGRPEIAAKCADNSKRYQKEGDDIQSEATKLQHESDHEGRRALRLHLGEIFLEIAIVFASVAILTKRPLMWWTGMISSAIGIAIAATEVLVK